MLYTMAYFKQLVKGANTNLDIDRATVQLYFKEDHGNLFVVFRGSNCELDWWNHMLCIPASIPYDNPDTKVRIHLGWLLEYKQAGVRDAILARVNTFIKSNPKGKVFITGHSYGGALAAICALDVQYNLQSAYVICIPLSMPRVGNKAFTESFVSRVKYRAFYYGADIVHSVPPKIAGYCHLPNIVHFGSYNPVKVICNLLLAGYWWLKKKPMQVEDITALWDHHYKHFPDDYEIEM
jgi:pimeloyl-ACP methyl ester carboxylesterase